MARNPQGSSASLLRSPCTPPGLVPDGALGPTRAFGTFLAEAKAGEWQWGWGCPGVGEAGPPFAWALVSGIKPRETKGCAQVWGAWPRTRWGCGKRREAWRVGLDDRAAEKVIPANPRTKALHRPLNVNPDTCALPPQPGSSVYKSRMFWSHKD